LSFTVSTGVQETLHKIKHKNNFIKEGLPLISEDGKCPFCEQKIDGTEVNGLITDYKDIFNQTFLDEEERINEELSQYKQILETIYNLNLPKLNTARLAAAKEFLTFDIPLPD